MVNNYESTITQRTAILLVLVLYIPVIVIFIQFYNNIQNQLGKFDILKNPNEFSLVFWEFVLFYLVMVIFPIIFVISLILKKSSSIVFIISITTIISFISLLIITWNLPLYEKPTIPWLTSYALKIIFIILCFVLFFVMLYNWIALFVEGYSISFPKNKEVRKEDLFEENIIIKHKNKQKNLQMLDISELESKYKIRYQKRGEEIIELIISGKSDSYLGSINHLNEVNFLKNFNSLEKLEILGLSFGRISNLDNLKNLKVLTLRNNNISKIEGLNDIDRLTVLVLSGNKISKIEGLEKLKILKYLYLSHNQISKIEGLDYLENLEMVDLSNNKISKIEGFEKLKNLISLNLSHNQISKIEGLKYLINLKKLDLNYNRIAEIEEKLTIKNLETLNLEDNRLESLKNIKDLPKLKVANINHNFLINFEGFNAFINIQNLHLSYNRIKELYDFPKFKELKHLYMDNNLIREIESFGNLVSLNILSLNTNHLKYIEGLHDLKNLEGLDLANNDLNQIPKFLDLKRLKKLNLKNNPIDTINNFEQFQRIEELNISKDTLLFNEDKEILNKTILEILKYCQEKQEAKERLEDDYSNYIKTFSKISKESEILNKLDNFKEQAKYLNHQFYIQEIELLKHVIKNKSLTNLDLERDIKEKFLKQKISIHEGLIINLLKAKENENLDFKLQLYKVNSDDLEERKDSRKDLIKDIISLLNITKTDSYFDPSFLIIGIGDTESKYNGYHNNVELLEQDRRTILQLIRNHIEPRPEIDIIEFFISGDINNIKVSIEEHTDYDKALIFLIKHQIGEVYEIKKDLYELRASQSFTRIDSNNEILYHKDRKKIENMKTFLSIPKSPF